MSYRFVLQDLEVICDTLDELRGAIGLQTQACKSSSQDSKGPQGKGPKKAWAEAEEYAVTHGVPKDEARRILAKLKRKAKAEAELQVTSR